MHPKHASHQEEQGEPHQMKAALAWDLSPELVFEFSCQSRTLEALREGLFGDSSTDAG